MVNIPFSSIIYGVSNILLVISFTALTLRSSFTSVATVAVACIELHVVTLVAKL